MSLLLLCEFSNKNISGRARAFGSGGLALYCRDESLTQRWMLFSFVFLEVAAAVVVGRFRSRWSSSMAGQDGEVAQGDWGGWRRKEQRECEIEDDEEREERKAMVNGGVCVCVFVCTVVTARRLCSLLSLSLSLSSSFPSFLYGL